MAGTTDTRIMQMRFENRQFEKNIRKSTQSLEELKAAMDFDKTSKGLEKFSQGMSQLSFSKLEDNIQKLTDKFTGLGTVSELFLSQIRRSIEQTAAKISGFVSSMTTQQVSEGMRKYEMLNRSVQTIMAATGESEQVVNSVLERLNKYTDQTSYSFADMAQNIGKFTSVGISLESAERMMEGIANWAARSGAGINEASRAMYNLSQAMGMGKLTNIDWKSIENAGMATKEFREQLIAAGVQYGTLEKTVDKKTGQVIYKTAKQFGKQIEVNYKNIRETFQKGWATNQVLGGALERYYYDDLYYEHEQKAILELNETQKKSFDEMIASGKSLSKEEWNSLSDMGVMTDETKQKIIDLAVSQGKLAKDVDKNGKAIYRTTNTTGQQIEVTFENLADSLKTGWFDEGFGESVTSINDLAKAAYEAAQKCLTFTDVLNAWKDQISTGWMNSYKIIFGDLSESMEFFSNVCNRVGDAISNLIDLRNRALKNWAAYGGRDSLLEIILGDYGKDVETGAVGFLDILGGVKDLIYNGFADFISTFTGSNWLKQKIHEDPAYMSAFLGLQATKLTQRVQQFMQGIRNFFNESIEVNGQTKSRLEVIQDVVSGIAGALRLGLDLLGGVTAFISQISGDLTPAFDRIIGLFGELGLSLYDVANDAGTQRKITGFFTDLATTLKPITSGISDVVGAFADLVLVLVNGENAGDGTQSVFARLGEAIKAIAGVVSSVAEPVLKFFVEFLDLVKDLITSGFSEENLSDFGEHIKIAFSTMFDSMPEWFKKPVQFIQDLFEQIKTAFKDGLSTESLETMKIGIRDAFDRLLEGIPESLKDIGSEIWATLTGLFTGEGAEAGEAVQSIGERLKGIFSEFSVGKLLALIVGGAGIALAVAGVVKLVKVFRLLRTGIGFLAGGRGAISMSDLGGLAKKIALLGGVFLLMKRVMNGDLDPEDLKAFGQKIVEAFSSFFESLKNLVTGKGTGQDVWEKLKAFGSTIGDQLMEWLVPDNLKQSVQKAADKLKAMMSGLWAKVREALFGSGEETGQEVSKFGPWLSEIFKKYDLSKVLLIALGAGGWALVLSSLKKVKRIGTKFVEVFKELLTTLTEGIDWQKLLLGRKGDNTKNVETFGAKILKIAAAIAIIVAAVSYLGDMETGTAGKGILALGGIMVLLARFISGMKNVFKDASVAEALSMVLGLWAVALAIGKLTKNLAVLGQMDIAHLAASVAAVGVLMWALNRLIKSSASINVSEVNLGGVAAIALSLSLLVYALSKIASYDFEEIGVMFAGLSGILLALGVFIKLTGSMSFKDSDLYELASLAVAVGILVLAVRSLGDMELGSLAKGVISMFIIMAALAGAVEMFQQKSLSQSGLKQLAFLAASVAVLAIAAGVLAKIPLPQLATGIVAIGVLVGILFGFSKLLGKSTSLQGTGLVQLIALALSVTVLVAALLPLAFIPMDRIIQMLVGLAGIITMLIVFIRKVSKDNTSLSGRGMASLIVVALSIALLVWSLTPLGVMDWGSLVKMGVGLVALMFSLKMIMKSAAEMDIKSGVGAMLMLLAIIPIVLVFAGALSQVGAIPADAMLAFSVGLAGVILAVAGAMRIVQHVDLVGGIKAILLIAAGIAAVMGVIALIGPMLIRSFSGAMKDVAVDMAEFSTLVEMFSNTMAKADNGGIEKGDKLIDKIKKIMEKIKGFGIGYKWNMDNFQMAMMYLGAGLGTFDWYTKELQVDASNPAFDVLTRLAGCAKDLKTITKLNLGSLTAKISGLGGAMSLYAMGAKELAEAVPGGGLEVDEGTVQRAVEILTRISGTLAKEGGEFKLNLPADLTDADHSEALGLFGANIAAIAGALIRFENAGQYAGNGGTDKAIQVLKDFSALNDDLTQQKAQLEHLDATDIEEINTQLEKSGAVTVTASGDTVMARFANNIMLLGDALKKFYESTTVLNNTTGKRESIDVGAAVSTLTSFNELQKSLPTLHGAFSWLTGEQQTLDELGASIQAAGGMLSKLNEYMMGVQDENGKWVIQPFNPQSTKTALDALDEAVTYLTETFWPRMGSAYSTMATSYDNYYTTYILPYTNTGYFNDIAGWGLDKFGAVLNEMSASIMGGTGPSGTTYQAYNPQSLGTLISAVQGMIWGLFRISFWVNLLGLQASATGGISHAAIEKFQNLADLPLATMGQSLSQLSLYIAGDGTAEHPKFDESSVGTVRTAALDIIALLKEVVTQSKAVDTEMGTTYDVLKACNFTFGDIANLGIANLGKELNALSGYITGKNVDGVQYEAFDATSIQTVRTSTTEIIEFLKMIQTDFGTVGSVWDTIKGWFTGHQFSADDLSGLLKKLGDGIGAFGAGIDTGKFESKSAIDNALSAVDGIMSIALKLSQLSRTEAYYADPTDWIQNMAYMMSHLTEKVQLKNGEWTSQSIVNDIVDFMQEIKLAMDELNYSDKDLAKFDAFRLAVEGLSALTTLSVGADFEGVGFNVAVGLATGIRRGIPLVKAAARVLGTSARDAANEVLRVKSPSRLFMEIGGYVAEGLSLGMNKGTDGVEKSGNRMAGGLVDTVTGILKTAEQAGSGFDLFGALGGLINTEWLNQMAEQALTGVKDTLANAEKFLLTPLLKIAVDGVTAFGNVMGDLINPRGGLTEAFKEEKVSAVKWLLTNLWGVNVVDSATEGARSTGEAMAESLTDGFESNVQKNTRGLAKLVAAMLYSVNEANPEGAGGFTLPNWATVLKYYTQTSLMQRRAQKQASESEPEMVFGSAAADIRRRQRAEAEAKKEQEAEQRRQKLEKLQAETRNTTAYRMFPWLYDNAAPQIAKATASTIQTVSTLSGAVNQALFTPKTGSHSLVADVIEPLIAPSVAEASELVTREAEKVTERKNTPSLLESLFIAGKEILGIQDEASQTAGALVTAINLAFTEGVDTTPTISPVLDMTQYAAQLAQWGLTTGGRTLTIEPTVSARLAGRLGDTGGAEEVKPTDLSGVYQRIDTLGSRIEGMSRSIQNMKIVLNTGVVAGGVYGDIDTRMGRDQFYASRRN